MTVFDEKQTLLFADMGRIFEFFSYDLESTLERFVESASHIQHFDEYAFVVTTHKGEIKVFLSDGLSLPKNNDEVKFSDFYPGDEAMYLVDEVDEKCCNIIFAPSGKIRSYVTIPLITQNELTGLFILGSKKKSGFDSELQDIFFSLGSFFAVAVENIRHFERSQDRMKVIISLQTSQQAIASAMELDKILAKVSEESLRTLGAECAAIYLKSGFEWHRHIFRSRIPAISPPDVVAHADLPIPISSALERTDVVFISKSDFDDLGAFRFSARPGSLVIVPLRLENTLSGFVILESSTFDSERLYLTQLFAGQVQVIFSNALLVKGLREKTAELEEKNKLIREYAESLQKSHDMLENRVKELSTLHDVSSALVSITDIDELLHFILNRACSVMRSDKGSLLLLDGDELKARCVRGNFGPSEIKFKLGDGIAGQVAKTGQSKIIENVLTNPKFKHIQEKECEREETMIAVPLLIDNRVIGVLNVDRELKFGVFTPDDERLLTSLASAAAEALARAQHILDLRNMNLETLEAFAMAVDTKDAYTHGHSRRVSYLSIQIANKLRLSSEEIEVIARAALLHDIGKIGISNTILFKQGRLTPEEYDIMKAHVIWGENILKPIKSLKEEAYLVRHHHECWNGQGYPDKLKGEEIPIGAAIISVSDAYDTMTSDRPYRRSIGREAALKELQKYNGTQFNPLVVGAFMMLVQQKDFSLDSTGANLREEIIGS